MRREHLPDHLSPMAYAVIALVGLVLGIGLLLFYTQAVPGLVQSGTQNQVFYILLIPWALSCAAFLFGAMKSYATFTQKTVNSVLELGGPVVLFCLVLIGGFRLVPSSTESFDLTVRAHSTDGHDPVVRSGAVIIDFDSDRRTRPFSSEGEAVFKAVPARFRGAQVKVLAQVDGYEMKWQEERISSAVLELSLARTVSMTTLFGSLTPIPSKRNDVKIMVDEQQESTSPNEVGRFELKVRGNPGDRVRIKVYERNKMVYDDYQVLPGPVTLSLPRE
jgi:hypothetical protein